MTPAETGSLRKINVGGVVGGGVLVVRWSRPVLGLRLGSAELKIKVAVVI